MGMSWCHALSAPPALFFQQIFIMIHVPASRLSSPLRYTFRLDPSSRIRCPACLYKTIFCAHPGTAAPHINCGSSLWLVASRSLHHQFGGNKTKSNTDSTSKTGTTVLSEATRFRTRNFAGQWETRRTRGWCMHQLQRPVPTTYK
jgi:hypothetical protein